MCGEALVFNDGEDEGGKTAASKLAKEATSLVKSPEGKDVPLASLVGGSGRPTVVVFLRHWLCPPCQKAAKDISDLWRSKIGDGGDGGPRLVAIGNGGVSHADRWRKMVNFAGEVFVSPSLDAYKEMQLSYGSKPIGCGTYALRWCDGFWKALAIVCCHCAFGMASEMGDVEQQGGTFVFDGDGKCVFAFRADDANQ
eukprot:gene15291-10086_t